MVLKTILHGQMTEKFAFEVSLKRVKNSKHIWMEHGQAPLFGLDIASCQASKIQVF